MRIVNPKRWMPLRGHSNEVRSEAIVDLAGQIGWDPTTATSATASFSDHMTQALHDVVESVAGAGTTPASIVEMTCDVTAMRQDRATGRRIGRGIGELFADDRPAMTLVAVTELVPPGARVEIGAVASDPDLLPTDR